MSASTDPMSISGSSPCTFTTQSKRRPSKTSMRGSAAAIRSVPVENSPSGRTAFPPNPVTCAKMRSSSVATHTAGARTDAVARRHTRSMRETPAIGASGLPGNRVDDHRAGITITLLMTPADSNVGETPGAKLERWLRISGMPGDDIRLVKKLAALTAFVFVFTAGFCHLERVYSRKFFDITGEARWIWAPRPMSAGEPIAFFASRVIDLPAHRIFTHLKILGDPEYTLWVNGRLVANRRVEGRQALDLYDLSGMVNDGPNRIVVAVRAPQGAGGLIAAVDIGHEAANWVVSDGSWRIYRRWNAEILRRDLPGEFESPAIIGEPPVGRWNFLEASRRMPENPASEVIQPVRSFRMTGFVPSVRTSEGIAISVKEPAGATVFDFGFTHGRLRLTLDKPRHGSHAMRVRFANDARELPLVEGSLRPVVFAAGEQIVTTPESRPFRYVMVFGRNVTAAVVR